MAKKSGNVPAGDHEPEIVEVLSRGDLVRIKQRSLMNDDLLLSPKDLYSIGHPNAFLVLESFEDPQRGVCIALRECCFVLEDHKNGKKLCKGHEALYFEKMGQERAAQKGDRKASIKIPWLGEVLGYDYQDDEASPSLRVRMAGADPIVLEGMAAQMVKKMLDGSGIKI